MNVNTKFNAIEMAEEECISVNLKHNGRDITLFLESTPEGIVIKNGTVYGVTYIEDPHTYVHNARILLTDNKNLSEIGNLRFQTLNHKLNKGDINAT